jgi:methionyl-tRNA formyltransferase
VWFGHRLAILVHQGSDPTLPYQAPGAEPYRDAHAQHMLTYGATVHFMVPKLDAGGQIIHQETFTVAPGTPLEEVVRIGQRDHEPRCLVEGLRRLLDREVELRFDKVVPAAGRPEGRRREEARLHTENGPEGRQSRASSVGPWNPDPSAPLAAGGTP